MKNQKGITLIALIITIIVMLILVGVSVTVALNGGLFNTAKTAKSDTQIERDKELAISNGDIIDKYLNKTNWEENQNALKDQTTGTVLYVGDIVNNYKAGGYTWQVLGTENGRLLLTTTETIGTATLTGSPENWDDTNQKWTGLENELNEACASKITDKGEAEIIRSINVEDINRLTGYDPENQPSWMEDQGYGEKVTITGKLPNGQEGSMEVTKTYYSYYVGSILGAPNDPARDMLIGTSNNLTYYLASSCMSVGDTATYSGLRCVRSGGEVGYDGDHWNSMNGATTNNPKNIRPVAVMSPYFRANEEEPKVAISIEDRTYNVGEVVTAGEESFYVIKDEDQKVTLLAKYSLNKAGTKQVNESNAKTGRPFSNVIYWSAGVSDLNTYDVPERIDGKIVVSAITTAKAYGKSLGGEGRLMRIDEAEGLEKTDEYKSILYGTYAADGYLNYWLGSTCDSNNPNYGLRTAENSSLIGSTIGTYLGIRPVIEVTKP